MVLSSACREQCCSIILMCGQIESSKLYDLLPLQTGRSCCSSTPPFTNYKMASVSRDQREKRIASLVEMGVSRAAAKAALRANAWRTDEVSLELRVCPSNDIH